MLVCLSCFHVFAGRAEVAARAAEAEAKKARLKAQEAADKERWDKEAAERERLAEIARYERRTAAIEALAEANGRAGRSKGPSRWPEPGLPPLRVAGFRCKVGTPQEGDW